MRGEPKILLTLLERMECKGGSQVSETEDWLSRLFEAQQLSDIWVVDIHPDTLTKQGSSAGQPTADPKCDRFLRLLCKNATIGSVLEAILVVPQAYDCLAIPNLTTRALLDSGIQLEQVWHPSRTEQAMIPFLSGKPERDMRRFATIWQDDAFTCSPYHSKAVWDILIDEIELWASEQKWCQIFYDAILRHIAKTKRQTGDAVALYKKTCPSYCSVRDSSIKTDKMSVFKRWCEEQQPLLTVAGTTYTLKTSDT